MSEDGRTVLVSNVAQSVSEEEIKLLFKTYGQIASIQGG